MNTIRPVWYNPVSDLNVQYDSLTYYSRYNETFHQMERAFTVLSFPLGQHQNSRLKSVYDTFLNHYNKPGYEDEIDYGVDDFYVDYTPQELVSLFTPPGKTIVFPCNLKIGISGVPFANFYDPRIPANEAKSGTDQFTIIRSIFQGALGTTRTISIFGGNEAKIVEVNYEKPNNITWTGKVYFTLNADTTVKVS